MTAEFTTTRPLPFVRTYETAAWWTEVTCPPQTVELLTTNNYNSTQTWARFTGTVTAESMATLYGGVPLTPGPDHTGRTMTHVVAVHTDPATGAPFVYFTDARGDNAGRCDLTPATVAA